MTVRFPASSRAVFALALTASLAACGDDDDTTPDTSSDVGLSDTGDVGGDVAPDTTDVTVDADVSDDTGDVGTDTPSDTTDAGVDTGLDTAPDTNDVGVDTTPDTADTTPDPLAVLGTYGDNFGGFLRVAEEGLSYSWYGDVARDITAYDNDAMWLVGQNASTDPWNADLWYRVDWRAADGESLYWCQTVFGAESEQAAIDADAADDTNWDTGCGGFPWSIVTPGEGPIAIAGDYGDDYGYFVGIDAGVRFSYYGDDASVFTQYSNSEEWAVGQNDATDPWNPEKWSKFEWIPADDGFYWCQTTPSAETEEDALTATADREDLDAGCNGFGWSFISVDAQPWSMAGEWWDNYGSYLRLANDGVFFTWFGDANASITQFDNGGEWAVGQNAATDEWNPEKWVKFEWMRSDEGVFYWCQTVFAADTEADAVSADGADRADLDAGCGGFPWSILSSEQEALVLQGDYRDQFGYPHNISGGVWTQTFGESGMIFEIARYDNDSGVLIAQNGASNDWFPSLWSRFDWTEFEGTYWFCQSAYDAETAAAAYAVERADDSAPSAGGCGGAPWSQLSVDL